MNKYDWSIERVTDAVNRSDSYSDVLRILGVSNKGKNSDTLKRKLKEYGISTDHFTFARHYKDNKNCSKYISSISYLRKGSVIQTSKLKEKLIRDGIKQNVCENPDCTCNNGTWLGKKLTCQLHHINGDNTDNRIENLIMLCPNCHSQTDNYCGTANIKKLNNNGLVVSDLRKRYYCLDCGNEITRNAKYCANCVRIHRRKVDRPTKDQLINDFKELKSFLNVSRKYKVTDNSIRKWCKRYNIPYKKDELIKFINQL